MSENIEKKSETVYAVENRRFENAGSCAALGALRRKFLENGAAESGRTSGVESGVETRTRYKIGRHSFEWEKKCGGATVQRAFAVKNGYELCSWNMRGEPVSKARFDRDHKWIQTAYYAPGTWEEEAPLQPDELLRPNPAGGLQLLTRDGSCGRYRVTLLVPSPARPGTPEQSAVNDRFGVPAVCAEISQGSVCYCPREEALQREAMLGEAERGLPDSIEPDVEGLAAPDFTYIENDMDPPRPGPQYAAAEIPGTLDAEYPANREVLCIETGEPGARRQKYPVAAKNREGVLVHTADVEMRQQVECIQCPEDMERIAREAGEFQEIPGPSAASRVEDRAELSREMALLATLQKEADELRRAAGAGTRQERPVDARGESGAFAPREEKEPDPPGTIARPAKRIVISETETYAYFGELLNGLREGQGRTEMPNGRTAYEGGYHADKREGFGVYYYKSGKVNYVGNWRENRREGMGVSYNAKDGTVFVGNWVNNVPMGKGSAFDSAGNLIYTGDWVDGRRCGYGTEYRNGRAYYAGDWSDDRWNGRGRLRLENGTMITGLFENGRVKGLNDGEDSPRG